MVKNSWRRRLHHLREVAWHISSKYSPDSRAASGVLRCYPIHSWQGQGRGNKDTYSPRIFHSTGDRLSRVTSIISASKSRPDAKAFLSDYLYDVLALLLKLQPAALVGICIQFCGRNLLDRSAKFLNLTNEFPLSFCLKCLRVWIISSLSWTIQTGFVFSCLPLV